MHHFFLQKFPKSSDFNFRVKIISRPTVVRNLETFSEQTDEIRILFAGPLLQGMFMEAFMICQRFLLCCLLEFDFLESILSTGLKRVPISESISLWIELIDLSIVWRSSAEAVDEESRFSDLRKTESYFKAAISSRCDGVDRLKVLNA